MVIFYLKLLSQTFLSVFYGRFINPPPPPDILRDVLWLFLFKNAPFPLDVFKVVFDWANFLVVYTEIW